MASGDSSISFDYVIHQENFSWKVSIKSLLNKIKPIMVFFDVQVSDCSPKLTFELR